MQGIKHGKQTPIAVGVMIALGMGVTGAQADFTDRESVEDLRGHMEERMNVEIQPGPESTRDTSERRQSGSTSNIGGADSTGTVVGGNPGGVGQTASEKCEDLGFEWDGGACVIDGEENVIPGTMPGELVHLVSMQPAGQWGTMEYVFEGGSGQSMTRAPSSGFTGLGATYSGWVTSIQGQFIGSAPTGMVRYALWNHMKDNQGVYCPDGGEAMNINIGKNSRVINEFSDKQVTAYLKSYECRM